MNRIYRSTWNEKTGMSIAASETAQSHGSQTSSVTGAVTGQTNGVFEGLALFLLLAFSSNTFALPTNGEVSAGSASISSDTGSMTIYQNTQNAAINWDSFGIGVGEAVSFIQPDINAIALNRVLGSDPSYILGSLSANGNVFLINPNGVIFGQSAQINVGGLVASTLNITDSDFMAGRYKFSGTSTAGVTNQGTITARDGGYVALLGANVSNEGTITAKLGTVALAGGEAATLDVAGDGLLNITVDQGAVNALVENGGLIQADGGQVLMTTQAAGNLLNTVVNNTGVIQAQTIENRNGVIKLLDDRGSYHINLNLSAFNYTSIYSATNRLNLTSGNIALNDSSAGSFVSTGGNINLNTYLAGSPAVRGGNITFSVASSATNYLTLATLNTSSASNPNTRATVNTSGADRRTPATAASNINILAESLRTADLAGILEIADGNINIPSFAGHLTPTQTSISITGQSAIASVISTSLNIPSPANITTLSNPGSSTPSPASGGPAGVDFNMVDAGTAGLQN